MLFKELTKVVAGNNLIERSKKMFWEVLQIYQQEDPKEFTEFLPLYIILILTTTQHQSSEGQLCTRNDTLFT